mmetsp:Transcript_844/g.2298  ORF Transcript_844/g.2298 Transcript_844/m.2298 type:complete len:265 (-) Transcript_844:221-1015(-)
MEVVCFLVRKYRVEAEDDSQSPSPSPQAREVLGLLPARAGCAHSAAKAQQVSPTATTDSGAGIRPQRVVVVVVTQAHTNPTGHVSPLRAVRVGPHVAGQQSSLASVACPPTTARAPAAVQQRALTSPTLTTCGPRRCLQVDTCAHSRLRGDLPSRRSLSLSAARSAKPPSRDARAADNPTGPSDVPLSEASTTEPPERPLHSHTPRNSRPSEPPSRALLSPCFPTHTRPPPSCPARARFSHERGAHSGAPPPLASRRRGWLVLG